MDVERGPDTQEHRCLQPADVGIHPALLFRGAESNPDQVRRCGVDPGDDLVVLLRRQGSKRRRIGPHDPESRETGRQPSDELIRDPLAAAIEEARPALLGGAGAQREHQVRSVYAGHPPGARTVSRPDHRHAVRRGQAGRVVDPQQLGIALALHHTVHAGDAHVVLLACRHPATDLVDRRRYVDSADADAEDVDPRDQPAVASGTASCHRLSSRA